MFHTDRPTPVPFAQIELDRLSANLFERGSEMADRLQQRVGNSRLIRFLGKGGYAEVYLGEHVHLKAHAALKVLQARLGNQIEKVFSLRHAPLLA